MKVLYSARFKIFGRAGRGVFASLALCSRVLCSWALCSWIVQPSPCWAQASDAAAATASRSTVAAAKAPATDDTGVPPATRDAGEPQSSIAALEAQARVLRHVVKAVRPSVVHIAAEKNRSGPAMTGQLVEEAGAGVIVKLQGKLFVLTNCHVIQGAPLRQIHLHLSSGRSLQPTRVLTDPESDIALLALSDNNLSHAKLGNSDACEIGDYVLAIGSPFGLSHSVTYGIISALARHDLELGIAAIRIQDFIQTDAAINPGNSGGPLVNLRGEVVGINTAIASDSGVSAGIAFSIPVNIARHVAEQLAAQGRVRRGYLGVEMDGKYDREKGRSLGLPGVGGCRLVRVTSGSPADEAKLQVGDILWTFNGNELRHDQDLVNSVALAPIGTPLPVVVYRSGRPIQLNVTLRERESAVAARR